MALDDITKRYMSGAYSKKSESSTKASAIDSITNKHISYNKTVNDEYLNTFITDVKSYINSAQDEYSGVGWDNAKKVYDIRNKTYTELMKRYNTIDKWLTYNEKNLDTKQYEALRKSLDEIDSGLLNVNNAFKSAYDTYSQFSTKEAADAAINFYNYEEGILNSADFDYFSNRGANLENPDYSLRYLVSSSAEKLPPIYNKVNWARENREKLDQDFDYMAGDDETPLGSYDFGYFESVANITDRQKLVYDYLVGRADYESANDYLNKLVADRNMELAADLASAMDNTALELVFNAAAGVGSWFNDWGGTIDFITGEKTSPSIIQSASSIMKSNNTGVWKGVNDLGYTVGNQVPSVLIGSFTGPIGGRIASVGSAMGGAYSEMRNLGYNTDQARAYAVQVAASEALLQELFGGITKLGGKYSLNARAKKLIEGIDNAWYRAALNIGSNMTSEALEEGVQTALEPVFKHWSTGEDLEAAEWSEIAYSALLGALSAGALEGPFTVGGTIKSNIAAKNTFDQSALIKDAMEAGGTAASLAQKYQGQNMSGNQLNTLAHATERTFLSQDKGKISTAVKSELERLGETGNVDQLSNIITKKLAGEKLTTFEKSALKKSGVANRILEKMAPENVVNNPHLESWDDSNNPDLLAASMYDNEFAENLGTKRIHPEAYNKDGVKQEFINKVVKAAMNAENKDDEDYKVSDEGKTIYNGEDVKIESVASVEDGDIKINLSNGQTVSAKDISFGSEAEANLYHMIARLGASTETANEILTTFATSNTDESFTYLTNVPLAYKYGTIGYEKGLADIDLPDNLKKIAYNHGRMDAIKSDAQKMQAKTEAKTEAKSSEKKTEKKTENKSKKKVIFEKGTQYSEGTANDAQRGSIGVAEIINAVTNLEVHVFASVLEDGKRVYYFNGKRQLAPNGFFKNGNQIYIDLNAGDNGEGAMLYTMSHEITHYIRKWNAKGFRELADFLVENYSKAGVSVEGLIEEQQKKIKNRYEREGKTLPSESKLYDMAYEEMVADAMADMLTDENAFVKLANLKQENRGLWTKIKDAFKNFIDKIKSFLSLYDKDKLAVSEEAMHVRGFSSEVFNKLQDLYLKAFAEADENYGKTIGQRDLTELSEAVNEDGEPLFQYRAMEADEDTYRKMLTKWGKMTDTEINNLFATIDVAMELIKDNLEALDYAWEADINDRAFSPVKPNSDKLYKVSLDFSTLCRKRLLQQTVVAQLQEALNKPLSKEEGIAVRDALIALQEEGRQIEVACALCYVESARMKSPEQIKKFIAGREKILKEFFAGKSGGDFKAKIKEAEVKAREKLGVGDKPLKQLPKSVADEIRAAKKAAKESYVPTPEERKIIDVAKNMTVSDFTTPEGLANLSKNYPSLFDAYTSYVRNATKSKGIEGDVWWRAGDSSNIGDVLIANMNKENGLRSQSWSDFQVIHILDYIAATIELATRNTKEQAYSKVPDYVELMGKTGVMINMSLIPTAKFSGSLEYDSTEGIDYNRALELREKYPNTAGTICIGMNNQQIVLLLADATIDYVIPYHKSGMSKATRKLMHMPSWSDYEAYQNETNLSRSDAVKAAKKYGVTILAESDPNYHKAPSFSEWFNLKEAQQIAKMENANPTDAAKKEKYGVMYGGYMAMQNAANNYLKLCAERGLSPKFSDPKADFSTEENYWKLLIDRKMVNNSTGEIIEQQTIKPIFEQSEIMRILNDELERYPKVKEDQEYAIRSVTEKVLSGEIKGGMSAEAIAKVMKKPVDNVTNVNILASAEEDAQFSERNSYSYETLTSKPNMKLTAINNVVKYNKPTKSMRVSAVNNALKNAKAIGATNSTGGVVVYVDDIGSEVVLSRKSLEHGLDRRFSENLPATLKAGEILKNAIRVNELTPKIKTAKSAYVLIGAAKSPNGDLSIVEFVVNEFTNEVDTIEVLKSVNTKKEEGVLNAPPPTYNTLRITSSDISITQLLEFVNNNFPDVLSESVLRHFGYTERPDGVLGESALYSERGNTVSNRTLLANALESTVTNEIEQKKLEQYKQKVATIDAEQAKLNANRAEAQELRFKKGRTPEETQRLKALDAEATALKNRITIYDKQLLNLESTAALKGVLAREMEKVRKKTEQKGRDALAAYKEKARADQIAIRTQYQESRKKAVESRNKTELRHKIKDFKTKLEGMLNHPTERNYVPGELAKAMIDVCSLIDTDTDLYKKDGSLNMAQVKRNETAEKLQRLNDEYDKLKNSSNYEYQSEYEAEISEYIKALRQEFSGKSLNDMDLVELDTMYQTLRSIEETLRDARKLIGIEEAADIYDVADSIGAEQDKITDKRRKDKPKNETVVNLTLSPVRNVERMSDYNKDSYLVELFHEFERGERKKNMFVMESYKMFDELTTGKNAKKYEEAMYEPYGETFTDVRGRSFRVSKMQMMQAIMSYQREMANGMNHIERDGFSFADLSLLKKGDVKGAVNNSHRIPMGTNMVIGFINDLSTDKWAQDYMAMAHKFFDEKAKNEVNDTYMTLKHRIVAKDVNYIPFEVDKNFIVSEISGEAALQQTINSYGMLKETKDNAGQPLIITGLNNVIQRHIDQVGTVVGLAVPVRNFNKVWNTRTNSKYGSEMIKDIIQRNWGEKGVYSITQTVQDLQGSRHNNLGAGYQKLKSGIITAKFTVNPSIVFKQMGSLFTASSELRWRDPIRAITNLAYTIANYKKIAAEVDKYTATAWMRRQGLSDAEVHTLMTEGRKWWISRKVKGIPVVGKTLSFVNPAKWITAMDSAVALSLWNYAKKDTAKRTGLEGEALLEATAELYDRVVENTQSTNDVLHRPEIQRSKDIKSELFGTFKTDLYQTAGQLRVNLGRFMRDKNAENGKALTRTVYGALMSSLWSASVTFGIGALLGNLDAFEDDDEEVTFESFIQKYSMLVVNDIVGYMLPLAGGELMEIVDKAFNGNTYLNDESFALMPLTTVNDLINSIVNVANKGEDATAKMWERLIALFLEILGVPFYNIKKILKAIFNRNG